MSTPCRTGGRASIAREVSGHAGDGPSRSQIDNGWQSVSDAGRRTRPAHGGYGVKCRPAGGPGRRTPTGRGAVLVSDTVSVFQPVC